MEERAMVLDMLAAGTLTVEQATQLLGALGAAQPPAAPQPQPQTAVRPLASGEEGGRRGRPRMRLDDLAGMKSVGVTAEYIRTMREMGVYAADPNEYTGMVACGVTPEYVAALRDAGLTTLDAGELTGMAAIGVTAEYIKALRDAGLTTLDAGEITGMAAIGVTAEQIAALRSAGIEDLDASQVMAALSSGLTPEYIAEMIDVGVVDVAPEVLAALRLASDKPAATDATIQLVH